MWFSFLWLFPSFCRTIESWNPNLFLCPVFMRNINYSSRKKAELNESWTAISRINKMLYLILILKWTLSDMNLALLFHMRRSAGRVVQWAMPPPHQFWADQLCLFQPGWTNYAHQINAAPLQIFGPSAVSGAGLGQKEKGSWLPI